MAKTFQQFVKAETVSPELGLVFGWAMICKKDGQDYWDSQENHIPEQSMLEALTDFAEHSNIAKEMHSGEPQGSYLFLFPLTTDIAKALGITCNKSGALVAYKPPPEVLAKYKSGEYTGFSIGGEHEILET